MLDKLLLAGAVVVAVAATAFNLVVFFALGHHPESLGAAVVCALVTFYMARELREIW